MADLKGVIINKGKVGVSVVPPDTSVSALIFGGLGNITTPADAYLSKLSVPNGQMYEFTTLTQAEAVGITADLDLEAARQVHRHISEFFRMAGEGTKLYVLLLSDNISQCLGNDNTLISFIYPLLIAKGKGEIRQIGIVDNRAYYDDEFIDKVASESIDNVRKAALLYQWTVDHFMPASIIVGVEVKEGFSLYDFRDEENINSSGVSVVCCQDDDFRIYFVNHKSSINCNSNQADIGTALGTMAVADINQNIGDNESFNLTDTNRSIWIYPSMCSEDMAGFNQYMNDDVFHLQELEDKGYIFATKYQGLNGLRWNNDHVCAPIVIDAEGNMNAHTIAYNRTVNEAMRSLRKVLIPKVKTRQPVDPKTGKLPVGVIKNFDNLGDSVFADMVNRGEISAGKTFTDPNSDLLVEKTLNVSFTIVPYGSIGEIRGTLNLKNKI